MIHNLNIVLYFVYLSVLILALVLGGIRYTVMSRSVRLFYAVVITAFAGEVLASFTELWFGNNNGLYNIFDLIHLLLVCAYFNSAIPKLRKHRLGGQLAAVSCIIWVVSFSMETTDGVNDPFLIWSGLLVISLCLALYGQLYGEKAIAKLSTFPDFWFASALLIYWSCNILNLQLFDFLGKDDDFNASFLNLWLIISNIIVFLIIAFTFFKLPQLITRKEYGQ